MLEDNKFELSEKEKIELRKQIKEALSKSVMYYDREDVPNSVHVLLSYYKSVFKTYPREKDEEETWEDYKEFLETKVNNKIKEIVFSDEDF